MPEPTKPAVHPLQARIDSSTARIAELQAMTGDSDAARQAIQTAISKHTRWIAEWTAQLPKPN